MLGGVSGRVCGSGGVYSAIIGLIVSGDVVFIWCGWIGWSGWLAFVIRWQYSRDDVKYDCTGISTRSLSHVGFSAEVNISRSCKFFVIAASALIIGDEHNRCIVGTCYWFICAGFFVIVGGIAPVVGWEVRARSVTSDSR